MSGGSYDYLYQRINDAADTLAGLQQTPIRRAFAAHLKLVAKAMHSIEWVDSCDSSPGSEDAEIRVCLVPGAELDAAAESLRRAIEEAQRVLSEAKEAPPTP